MQAHPAHETPADSANTVPLKTTHLFLHLVNNFLSLNIYRLFSLMLYEKISLISPSSLRAHFDHPSRKRRNKVHKKPSEETLLTVFPNNKQSHSTLGI
ncbi:MAG: hypothetical protein CME28_03730 [Gemmatimonadetes bacterium]|nr:hypothetical protein [Gemmatimonadota bacterium]